MTHRIFDMAVSAVYPHYVNKVERKGQSVDDLITVLTWLTGYSPTELQQHIDSGMNFRDFFENATLNENVSKITGVICGMRVEEIEDPLMQKIRYMDKIVDELANGKKLEKILRA